MASFGNWIDWAKFALLDPKWGANQIKRKIIEIFLWDYYYSALRKPKKKGAVKNSPSAIKNIVLQLKKNSITLKKIRVSSKEYLSFLKKANYAAFPKYYDGGKASNFVEKSIEHFLASKLLRLKKNDIYIDIANANSPTPEIYCKIFGCKAYRQDLVFKEGITGNKIGGNAANMPLPNNFATKMALHCSFEHFEGNSDKEFIVEAKRILRKDGRVCIVPLYLASEYAIQTDPACLSLGKKNFEKNAILYCAKGWALEHARFYSVQYFLERIKKNAKGMKLTVFLIKLPKIFKKCYVKFALLLEKK